MDNITGLELMPRAYHPSIPSRDIPYLEDIRRAANAVRVLRRNGKSTSAARFRMKQATEAYHAFLERERQAEENPPLF